MAEKENKHSHPPGDPVRAAQVRALISNYVVSHEEPVFGQTLLDDIGPEVEKLGITRSGAYYHLRTMEKNGLIGSFTKPGNKTFYTKPGVERGNGERQQIEMLDEKTVKTSRQASASTATAAVTRLTIDVIRTTGRIRVSVAGLEIDIGVAEK